MVARQRARSMLRCLDCPYAFIPACFQHWSIRSPVCEACLPRRMLQLYPVLRPWSIPWQPVERHPPPELRHRKPTTSSSSRLECHSHSPSGQGICPHQSLCRSSRRPNARESRFKVVRCQPERTSCTCLVPACESC